MNAAINPFFFNNKHQAGNNFNLHKSKKSSPVPHNSRINFKNRKSSLVNRKSKKASEMSQKSQRCYAVFMCLPWGDGRGGF